MWLCYFTIFTTTRRWRNTTPYVTSGFIRSVSRHLITHTYALEWFTDFGDQSGLSDMTYNEKWDAKKFTINARLKILTRSMLNRVNRRVNAINPAALLYIHWASLFLGTCDHEEARVQDGTEGPWRTWSGEAFHFTADSLYLYTVHRATPQFTNWCSSNVFVGPQKIVAQNESPKKMSC